MHNLATLQSDNYKQNHKDMYHPEVSEVYSNYTNRNGKYFPENQLKGVVFAGLQYSILDYLMDNFQEFFAMPRDVATMAHKRVMSAINGEEYDVKHLEELHDLGYLPLEIKALPEGTVVPYGVPCFTMRNTHPGFFWLTNGIETVLSAENWPIQTSATSAANYKLNFLRIAKETGIPLDLLPFLGHDFSFRGMMGRQAAAMSGFGHLTSFAGTDTVPAVTFAEKYYYADLDNELVGSSVPATEHSVMCSWQGEGEVEAIRHLVKKFPSGILSIVSDTWDFWRLVTEYLPVLKDEIEARPGKVVIRPDSGDPVDILCGVDVGYSCSAYQGDDGNAYWAGTSTEVSEAEQKGLIECLWDIFGGEEIGGFKHLAPCIGAIYGDSITLARQEAIIKRLTDKGFAPAVVLGIGSFTYQHVTRDTHGSAIKATSVIKQGEREAIFKDPKTDPGKKSAKGLLKVFDVGGNLVLEDDVTEQEECEGLLETVFLDGELVKRTTLKEIRERVDAQLEKLL